jgi:hypothetical protein
VMAVYFLQLVGESRNEKNTIINRQ